MGSIVKFLLIVNIYLLSYIECLYKFNKFLKKYILFVFKYKIFMKDKFINFGFHNYIKIYV
jgi:hypothetical protein